MFVGNEMRKLGNLTEVFAIFVFFLILLPALAPCVRAQPGSVSLYPTADTYVDSSNPNSNYGAQGSLYVSNSTISERIAWLKFNLTSVPNIGFVDTATLQLYATIVTETYTVSAHYCSSNSWSELALTYSNMPSYNNTAMDYEMITSGWRWCNWSVLDGVKVSSGFVTIVVSETTLRGVDSRVVFNSKDSFIAPQLIIHWTDVPEFPMFLILPLLLVATLMAVIIQKSKVLHSQKC